MHDYIDEINNVFGVGVNEDEREDEDDFEIKRFSFNSYRIEKSVRDILSLEERGRIEVPDFQRDEIWTNFQAGRFIESILLGLPTPDFFMFKYVDNNIEKFMLVDGLQRYTTIKHYYNGDDTFNGKLYIRNRKSPWYRKTYKELEENDKDFFNDYSIKINVFDSLAEKEVVKYSYMTEIFSRINTGSTKLSDQEIRNAVYRGDLAKKLKTEVKNDQYFKELIKRDIKKYNQKSADVELLLRFLTYNLIYKRRTNGSETFSDLLKDKFTNSKKNMISNYMYFSNKRKIDYLLDIELLLKAFKDINNKIPDAFYAINRNGNGISDTISETFSEAIVISVLSGQEIRINNDKLNSQKEKIWNDKDNFSSFFVSTTNLDNIKYRVNCVKKILDNQEVLNDGRK